MTTPYRVYVTPNIAKPGAIDALALVKDVDYGFPEPNVPYVREGAFTWPKAFLLLAAGVCVGHFLFDHCGVPRPW